MQLTGSLFADMSAIFGNELSTFPDYPAEIRAPHGTVSGVSGFQVHIGSEHVTTPGDFCDLLVAMNPAALKANARWLKRTAMVLIDSDTFDEDGLKRAGLHNDPIRELYIEDRTIIVAPITTLTEESLKDSGRRGFIFREMPIPPELLAGKKKVEVRFVPKPGNIAGGLFGLWMVPSNASVR